MLFPCAGACEPGQRVIIVEDVVVSGESLLEVSAIDLYDRASLSGFLHAHHLSGNRDADDRK